MTAKTTKREASPALAKKLEAVVEAGTKLRSNHFGWIIGWAIRECTKELEDAEAELARHLAFMGEGDPPVDDATVWSHTGSIKHTRREAIAETRRSLAQHRAIRAYLAALSDAHNQAEAEQFAVDMVRSGLIPPRGKR